MADLILNQEQSNNKTFGITNSLIIHLSYWFQDT